MFNYKNKQIILLVMKEMLIDKCEVSQVCYLTIQNIHNKQNLYLDNNLKMNIIGTIFSIKILVNLWILIIKIHLIQKILIKWMINKKLQNMDKIQQIYHLQMVNIYKKIYQIKSNLLKIIIIELIQVHLIILLIFILVHL